ELVEIADRHEIGVMCVLCDSVWDPHPKLGKQRDPQAGLHNSGWVQSPGADDLTNPQRHKVLIDYVRGVIGHFKDDRRVHAWDIWNEPDNQNDSSYGRNGKKNEPPREAQLALQLVE